MGFPIRTSPVDSACLAAHRGLSQLATSFIGLQSRGIRVMRGVKFSSQYILFLYHTGKQHVLTM